MVQSCFCQRSHHLFSQMYPAGKKENAAILDAVKDSIERGTRTDPGVCRAASQKPICLNGDFHGKMSLLLALLPCSLLKHQGCGSTWPWHHNKVALTFSMYVCRGWVRWRKCVWALHKFSAHLSKLILHFQKLLSLAQNLFPFHNFAGEVQKQVEESISTGLISVGRGICQMSNLYKTTWQTEFKRGSQRGPFFCMGSLSTTDLGQTDSNLPPCYGCNSPAHLQDASQFRSYQTTSKAGILGGEWHILWSCPSPEK